MFLFSFFGGGGGGGEGVSLWSLVCGVDSLFLCDDLLLVFLVSVWLARKLTIIAEVEQEVRRREEESEEGWVRQIGEGENVCVCGLRVKL
jgi:hypothetical protein